MNAVVQKALRRGTRRAVDPVTPQTDYGPGVRHKRGEIEKGWRPDPDNPNREVRGAKCVWQPDRMHRAGTITLTQFLTCERYDRTVALASGAKLSDYGAVGRLPPWEQGTPAERTLNAQTALRRADEALGPEQARLIRLLVLCNKSVAEIAAMRGERDLEAKGRVLGAVDRLAEWWGMV